MRSDRWLLPEGVQEILPPDSWRLEAARRRLLDLYWLWGFDLVRPPLIEYLESLLTGAGHDLDLHTFKLTDQLSGRMMGVRSDITTQAARIDARRMQIEGPVRYCYIGSVLRTRPEEPGGSRAPLQIGVELFGHAGLDSDLEVLSLMLETLREMQVELACLDLGHVQIYRRLVALAAIDGDAEARLFDIMQRKSAPDLADMIADGELSKVAGAWFARLIQLNGDPDIIAIAQDELGCLDPNINAALERLAATVARLQQHYPDVCLHIDLAELRGYRYKTGLVFAAFSPGLGRELARGGRYDNVGAAFGRARAATGFSADLNLLAGLGRPPAWNGSLTVYAPAGDDPELLAAVRALRAAGRRVVVALPGQAENTIASGCGETLESIDGVWQSRPITG